MTNNEKLIVYWQSMLDMCMNQICNLERDFLKEYDAITHYQPKTVEEIELHMELTSYIKHCENEIEKLRGD